MKSVNSLHSTDRLLIVDLSFNSIEMKQHVQIQKLHIISHIHVNHSEIINTTRLPTLLVLSFSKIFDTTQHFCKTTST